MGSLIPKRPAISEPEIRAAVPVVSVATDVVVPKVTSAAGIPLIVPIERIVPNPHQPREHFDHAELEDLIASIKTHGILQPLVVTEKPDGTYELIAGERRLRASRLAGLAGVPVVLRDAAEQDKLELALIENIQRQDLNPIEEGKAYRHLMQDYGLTQEEVSKRVGKSRSQVANTVRLLELPEDIQQAVQSGQMQPSAARTLLAIESKEEQLEWWRRMSAEKLTVRDIEEAARRVNGPRKVSIPDANIEADEAVLRGALGTKATVKKRGESGQIAIHFFSNEEYRALIDRLANGVS